MAWQALSKSASFALGWATAIYFGQVPGRQGRVLSVISLVAAGWVILVVGFAIPIFGGAALEALGIIEENFDVHAADLPWPGCGGRAHPARRRGDDRLRRVP